MYTQSINLILKEGKWNDNTDTKTKSTSSHCKFFFLYLTELNWSAAVVEILLSTQLLPVIHPQPDSYSLNYSKQQYRGTTLLWGTLFQKGITTQLLGTA